MSPPDEIQTPPGPPDAIGKPPEGDYTPPRSELETEGSDQQTKWLTGARLRWVGTAFALADLMLAIDSTILATAIPHISTDFHSLDYIGWWASAYLLTQMACQPLFGRIYAYFESKSVYLASLLVFEVGSVVCATARAPITLVLGRAVAGCGAAGMLTGSLAIFGQVVHVRKRAFGMSIMGALASMAGMLGTTVGGVITDSYLTWRFCFWMNLPFGFATAVVVFFVLDRRQSQYLDLPLSQRLRKLDPAGVVLVSASLVCLFLVLQWGGPVYRWSDPHVWGCIIGSGLLAVMFVGYQAYMGDQALIPPRIIKQRTVATCCLFGFLYGMSNYSHAYLLPTYFQGVQETSAAVSGALYLSTTIPMLACSLTTGFLVTKFGYYVPFMWLGSAIYVAGSALLYQLRADSVLSQWVGYQVVAGMGVGTSAQVGFIAVQVVSSEVDMPTACAMLILFRLLGASIGISVAENLFAGAMKRNLEGIVPGLESESILRTGIADLVRIGQTLTPPLHARFKDALSGAVVLALILPVVATSLAAVTSWAMEWRQIPDSEDGELIA